MYSYIITVFLFPMQEKLTENKQILYEIHGTQVSDICSLVSQIYRRRGDGNLRVDAFVMVYKNMLNIYCRLSHVII